jgi:hypothetical protein
MENRYADFYDDFLSGMNYQKQLACLTQWFNLGLEGLKGGFTVPLQNMYGLAQTDEGEIDYLRMWNKAQEEIKNSFRDYLNLLGFTPRDESVAIAKRCEELEKMVASQDEISKQMQRMLGEVKETHRLEMRSQFVDLLEKQSEQHHQLMNSLTELFREGSSEAKEACSQELASRFEALLTKQNEQHQQLMNRLSELFGKDSQEQGSESQ